MDSTDEDRIYQRIGEFVVSFQWIENKLREIGCFILDPERNDWPPSGLKNLSNEKLVNRVHQLFIDAMEKCDLGSELELEFKESFDSSVDSLHRLRRDRNRILHSAFIELKAGGEVHGILRSNPKLTKDEETGEVLFDQEALSSDTFDVEMMEMANLALFLNRAYVQLMHRYPNGSA